MQTEIVLVRHASSVERTADGPVERRRPLTPDGMRQALALSQVLSTPRPAAIWSSPYLRAVQTVEPTAQALGLEVRTRWELREWDDGLPFTVEWIPHYERSWADRSFARPGGESLSELGERAVRAVRALVATYAGQRVVVGGHGNFISQALDGFGMAADWRFVCDMPMPAVYHLRFDEHPMRPDVAGLGLPRRTFR